MIYILLVNWNGASDLLECLESLLRLRGNNYCIVICDNGSTDDSFVRLKRWASGTEVVDRSTCAWNHVPNDRLYEPEIYDAVSVSHRSPHKIYWLPLGYNAGFAAANNKGMEFAFADRDTRFVWLLNSDTIVMPNSLDEMVSKAISNSNIGIVGSTLRFYNNPNKIQALGVYYDSFSHRGIEIHRGKSVNELPDVSDVELRLSYIVGASMLVSRNFYEQVGPMEESYFLYFEEMDWAMRSRGRYTLAWADKSHVFHKEGGSIGTNADSRPSDTAIYYLAVNMLRFSSRYRHLSVLTALLRICGRGLRSLIRRDWRAATVIYMALTDWVTGHRRQGPILLASTTSNAVGK